MKKGSITPFCALSLILIASLLFVLLESARVYGLERYAQLKSNAAMDSVCAEFQPYLWQQYGLLFLDGAYGTEEFSMGYVVESLESYMEESCNDTESWKRQMGQDLFRLTKGEVLLEGYALASDEEGELFLTYVANRRKEELPLGIAADLYETYQKAEKLGSEYEGMENSVAEAKEVIAEAKAEWIDRQETEENDQKTEEKEEEIFIPDTSSLDCMLDDVQEMSSSGILNQIFADLSGISTQSCSPFSRLKERNKPIGTMYYNGEKDWYRKMLVIDYLDAYFGNYTKQKEEHLLKYEMEYVIGGKDTEWENLESTIQKLLLVREAANAAHILQDEKKMEWVSELAAVIGLLAGENPAAVSAVKIGIVGAWAYMESVLDVRTLMEGGVIPIMKQKQEWTSDVDNLFIVFDKNAKAKQCEEGLNYTEYLKMLVSVLGEQELAYRMMEVMEMGMQSQSLYQNCRMDYMVVMMRFKVFFKSEPLFSSLAAVGSFSPKNYVFAKEIERTYIP